MKSRVILIGVLIAAATSLTVAACGGGGDSVKADVTIDIKAENMRFVPAELEVPAGKTVLIRMQNTESNQHDFEVGGLTAEILARTGMTDEGMAGMAHEGMSGMGNSAGSQGAINMHSAANGKASVTFRTDKAGTYDIYCTMPGHKESGMVGKLVVTAAASTGAGSTDASLAAP